VGGIGGTLAGNALSLAAMRVTLEKVLTAAVFEKMIPLAKRFNDGVAGETSEARIAVERDSTGRTSGISLLRRSRRGTAGSQRPRRDFELERFLHLYALNRGLVVDRHSQHGADEPGDDRSGWWICIRGFLRKRRVS